MRLSTYLVASAVLASSFLSTASAGFSFSNTRTAVSIGGKSYDRVTFFAKNNGGGTGTKLQAIEMTVTTPNAMLFQYADLDGDDLIDVDLLANRTTLTGNLQGTKVMRELFAGTFDLPFANISDPSPENVSTDTYDAVAAYTNRKSFYALGSFLGPTAPVANNGNGLAFLTVITAPLSTISVSGGIGGDQGGAGGLGLIESPLKSGSSSLQAGLIPFSYVAAVPEPATLAGLAVMGVVLSRRRA